MTASGWIPALLWVPTQLLSPPGLGRWPEPTFQPWKPPSGAQNPPTLQGHCCGDFSNPSLAAGGWRRRRRSRRGNSSKPFAAGTFPGRHFLSIPGVALGAPAPHRALETALKPKQPGFADPSCSLSMDLGIRGGSSPHLTWKILA